MEFLGILKKENKLNKYIYSPLVEKEYSLDESKDICTNKEGLIDIKSNIPTELGSNGKTLVSQNLKSNNKETIKTRNNSNFSKNCNTAIKKSSKIGNSKSKNHSVIRDNVNSFNTNKNKNRLDGYSKKNKPFCANAFLQCLSNVKRLRNFLLQQNNYNNLMSDKNKKVSFAFAKFLKLFWQSKESSKKFYDSTQFKKIILEQIIELRNNDNPIEIFKILLSKINEELSDINKINNAMPNIKENGLNIFDCNEVKNSFIKKYNKYKSIIADEFCGFIMKETYCQICKISEYHSEQYYYLDFEIGENIEINNTGNKNIKINDYFDYLHTSQNEINDFICKKCGKERKAIVKKNIFIFSKTLIIYFNINIFKNIDKIILEESLNIDGCSYSLIAVIMQYNKNNFISYCKNSFDNKWYRFKDETITESSFKIVLSINNPLIIFLSRDESLEKKNE